MKTDPAAQPAETSITTALAFDLMKRYLAPMSDFSKLELAVELDQVVSLLDPQSCDTWTWAIDKDDLTRLLTEYLIGEDVKGFATDVHVEIDEWDTDLGDNTSAFGYRIEIKAEVLRA